MSDGRRGVERPGVDMSGSGAGVLSKLAAASRSRPSAEARSGRTAVKPRETPRPEAAHLSLGGIDSYRNTGGRWGVRRARGRLAEAASGHSARYGPRAFERRPSEGPRRRTSYCQRRSPDSWGNQASGPRRC